ncbi:MAG: DUF4920 domain-containing protein [Planctomycetota bacterium]
MKHLMPAFLIVLVAGCASTASDVQSTLPEGTAFGEPMAAQPVVSLATVEADPSAYYERTLLVEATATAVCQKAGCWMKVEDGDTQAIVRWEAGCGGAYEFPRDLAGQRVIIQGSYYPKTISPADAEHMQEEAGRTVEIAQEGHEFNASAILVVGN